MHISTLCCNPETACFRGCYWNLSCLSASRFSFSHWIWFDTHSPTILKGINTKQSSEGPMPTPRLQYFGHLMQRAGLMRKWVWCWERLKVGGEGGDRGWDGWMASPTQWTCNWANSESWWWTGRLGVLQSMGLQRVGHDWATERQQQIFEIRTLILNFLFITRDVATLGRTTTANRRPGLKRSLVILLWSSCEYRVPCEGQAVSSRVLPPTAPGCGVSSYTKGTLLSYWSLLLE